MKLGFVALEIHEFCSIPELTVQLDRPAALWFVFGENQIEPTLQSNGCGKSTIFSAVSWAMYGKTAEGLRNPDVIPWSGGSPYVELHLSRDGNTHVLARGANPNTLSWDQREIDQRTLEKLLGMNYDTFKNTVLLGQGQPLFLDLTPSAKLALFSNALALERWDQRAATAATQNRQLEISTVALKTAAEGVLQQFNEVKQLHETTKQRANDWEAVQLKREAEFNNALIEINKTLITIQRRHDDANLAYDGAGVELAPLRHELIQLRDYLAHTQRELLKAENTRQVALDKRSTLRKELASAKRGICPTCGGPLKSKKHQEHLAEQLKELENAGFETAARGARILRSRAPRFEGQIELLVQQQNDLEEQLDRAEQAEGRFAKKEADARQVLDAVIPQLADLKAKKQWLENERRQTNVANPFTVQLRELRARRAELVADYKTKKAQWQDDTARMARVGYWAKGFKDIKLFIIEEVLQELRLHGDAILAQLGLAAWSLEFDVEKETKSGTVQRGLNVFVHSPHNDHPVRWESWSGGERQRLRIAGALALSEVLLARAGVEPSITVVDEGSAHLSSQGVHDLVEFLAERARQLGRITYFVDQTATPSDRFAGILTVIRAPEGTKIVETA